MSGIDTNVLVRYITRDHSGQYEAAKRHLESDCTEQAPGQVSTAVLCELVWVLTKAYDADREEIARVIDQILQTRQLQVQRQDQVRKALTEFASGGAGFADCLIGHRNRQAGAEETVTFDQEAARLTHWRELEWWWPLAGIWSGCLPRRARVESKGGSIVSPPDCLPRCPFYRRVS